MTLFEVLQFLSTAIRAAGDAIVQVTRLEGMLQKVLGGIRADVSYENLLLDLVVDIRDPRGTTAVVERRQRVRFLTSEAGVVRDIVWGDGKLLAGYSTPGVRFTVRPEGSRRVVLIALDRAAVKDENVTLSSRRVIRRGFMETVEYYEAMVERPTRRLSLKVLFPRSRPPASAYLVASPSSEPPTKLAVHYGSDRRPFLAWGQTQPRRHCIYSLRWSW